jgi:hypothetical protein
MILINDYINLTHWFLYFYKFGLSKLSFNIFFFFFWRKNKFNRSIKNLLLTKQIKNKGKKKKFFFRFKKEITKFFNLNNERIKFIKSQIIGSPKNMPIKVKRQVRYFNYLKLSLVKNTLKYSTISNRLSLVKRFFLTKKTHKAAFINFFYKRLKKHIKLQKILKHKFISFKNSLNQSHKYYWTTNVNFKKKKKHHFIDLYNRTLLTYRIARTIHWKLHNKIKTLRENRYRLFLKKQLKKQSQDKLNIKDDNLYYYLLNLKFKLSWTQWHNFSKYLFPITKETINNYNLIQFPINLNFWVELRKFKFKQRRLLLKAKRWGYLQFKKNKYFWMLPKKNTPKYFKRLQIHKKSFKNIGQYDKITNSFLILNISNNIEIKNLKYLDQNMLIKTYNFRYKA